ncbi:5'/3'-nucleotidase SurE [Haloprofundus sp. MHR1]|uniref:5'/3'-nucleotidase SurE n=1 Tax=Haloprofundus sp. MHR1 TaxID=2572921 RepID=UPI0010BE4DE3|nr:5'/3'-nucleotidase SurE [Haloprofundus sp. MHR1]QCJ48183.1 5'/3'-nucleotidase SurE [Haloprofundus sp. MHR1]
MDRPRILLTNDDGIESVGFVALYDALSTVADVTAVAPADDQSAVGRQLSRRVDVAEHELGYVIEGTPADCAVVGLESLCPDADMVVAGCNKGANLGAYVLGRSGTVSAAVEAAFFSVPAIAVSLYIPAGEVSWEEAATEPDDFREATDAAVYLVENAPEAGVFEQAEYLNVNAPLPGDDPAPMQVTRPSTMYEMTADHDSENGHITLTDNVWTRMRNDDIPDPDGTDRRAIVDGKVSVSPLTAPHTTERHESLDGLAVSYRR